MKKMLFLLLLCFSPSLRADPEVHSAPGKWFPFFTMRTIPANLHLADGTVLTGKLVDAYLNMRHFAYMPIAGGLLIEPDPRVLSIGPFLFAGGIGFSAINQYLRHLSAATRFQFVEGNSDPKTLFTQIVDGANPDNSSQHRYLSFSKEEKRKILPILHGRKHKLSDEVSLTRFDPVAVELSESTLGHALQNVVLRDPQDYSLRMAAAGKLSPAFDCSYFLRRVIPLPVLQ